MIANREGFGDILAEGMMRVRGKVSAEAAALFPRYVAPIGSVDGIPPRVYLPHALLYPFENRMHPITVHEMGYVNIVWSMHQADPESSPVSGTLPRFRRMSKGLRIAQPAAEAEEISLYQTENTMPEITTAREALEALSGSGSAEKLKGVDATILFDLSGEESGQWTVTIDDGQVDFTEGSPEPPTVTVEATAEDLKALVRGELNPMAAFMQGRVKVKGDMSIAMQLQKLFS